MRTTRNTRVDDGREGSGVLERWFGSETEFLDEKQDEKMNEKQKVSEKHLSEVFFSFILFLSRF
jgi:hypothetical protein